jgi:5'-3' exonuclease
MGNPKILCIDGMNFLHRARSGWQLGSAPVIFNFMRNFRAQVELHKPTRVYFVLEGHPQQRKDILPEYKANRVVEPGTPEHDELVKFFEQVHVIVDHLSQHFPVSVVRHPHYECDDTIYNLIKRSSSAVPWVVASNDSDFTQLLNEFPNVSLYNPMKKEFVEVPDYDYVTWKALRGDPSDNIPGIITDGAADRIVNDPEALSDLLLCDSVIGDTFSRNYELIKFITWSDDEALEMSCSHPTKDWEPLRKLFEQHDFKSLLKDKTWDKFVATFEPLWGEG